MFDPIHWLEAYFIDDHEQRRKGVQQQPGARLAPVLLPEGAPVGEFHADDLLARKSELMLARWEHVDVEKAEWHIPGENSTTGGVCGRNPELV
jgi:hypothetical protein